jgi:hypothetical protein
MKTGLIILLLLLGWSLKAPPMPPPPNRAAGGLTNTGLYFTNSGPDGLRIVSQHPPMPGFGPPIVSGKMVFATNHVVQTNTPAQLAADRAHQADIRQDSIGLFIVGGLTMLYVFWAGCRGSVFMFSRRFAGFIERQQDPAGYWMVMVVDFGLASVLIYLAINEWRMLH